VGPDGPGKEEIMREETRKEIERILFDLTYDLEFIEQESEIGKTINKLFDLVREHEEEEA
jgi:hypothetical protein